MCAPAAPRALADAYQMLAQLGDIQDQLESTMLVLDVLAIVIHEQYRKSRHYCNHSWVYKYTQQMRG